MNEYTIYCTAGQTKKALELGAPLFEVPYVSCTPVIKTEEELYYEVPTAEQMIGYLEQHGEFKVIAIHNSRNLDWSFHITTKDKDVFVNIGYHSRKEATLAAIDAALEYLSIL